MTKMTLKRSTTIRNGVYSPEPFVEGLFSHDDFSFHRAGLLAGPGGTASPGFTEG